MKYSPIKIGFLEAAGIALYVVLFASIVNVMSVWFPNGVGAGPFQSITLFLLAFIISATICGSLMFAYPIFLFIKNKRSEAFRVFLWALGWLLFFFLCFGLTTLFFLR